MDGVVEVERGGLGFGREERGGGGAEEEEEEVRVRVRAAERREEIQRRRPWRGERVVES